MSPTSRNRLDFSSPGFLEILLKAGGRTLLLSTILAASFFFVSLLISATRTTPDSFGLGGLVRAAGMFWIILFGVLLPIVFIFSSRILADRAFTIAGFCATFLGLGILAFFFFQLGQEVAQWFERVPEMVRTENARNQALIDNLEQAKKNIAQRLQEAEKERDLVLKEAATPEERKELETLFAENLPRMKADLDKTVQEIDTIAHRRMRPDPTPWNIFLFFLTHGPDGEPQDAGILPALMGSLFLGIITLLFSVPVGVGAALYLEEYRGTGRMARLIQVNINNLAGVPSVVFGILGGFVFVGIFRELSTTYGWQINHRNLLGGGLTLGLLTMPMVIVASQEAIRAVPGSLRQGAYALGATKWQVMWYIVLPMARPGIMTGAILSLARAIGEAAPLVMFGALTFVSRIPTPFTEFTAMPLQIFNWSDRPADIWRNHAALGSLVLLTMLLSMNLVAIILRNRAQKKMHY